MHPIPGQFPAKPTLAKATMQPTAISSLTTNCETISLANIQLPTFIGDILAVSRKYLSCCFSLTDIIMTRDFVPEFAAMTFGSYVEEPGQKSHLFDQTKIKGAARSLYLRDLYLD